ncbi:MAG: hypothetical protein R8G66_07635 [Cytophagales bacterium]|nr:hypothetical protein [Cytophagales bacterium]
MTRKDILISPALRDFIIPLSDEEKVQLESSIMEEGCRDALIAWENPSGELVLIDGHHRYGICSKHDIPFDLKVMNFEGSEEVKQWMITNQLGRRNLSKEQTSYYRGLKYLKLRQKKGGYEAVLKKGQVESTAEALSKEFKVSESTIRRDAKFAEALELVGRSNAMLRNQILTGDTDLNKSDILMLLNADDQDNLVIRNEADLYNKAKHIEQQILDHIEDKVHDLELSDQNQAENNPPFLEREDRIRNIKGKIISSMNKAINNEDEEAIEELKGLVSTLQKVIFSNS